MRILVFGDSVAYGAWDSQGGWVERLKQYAHKQTVQSFGQQKMQVLNLGIGGDSSPGVLARLENEMKARESEGWPLLLIFQFCANDARTIDGIPETSIDEFNANCEKILKIALKETSRILFVGEPVFAAGEISFKGVTYASDKVLEYEKILEEMVTKNGVPFISLRSQQLKNSENIISFDGIHPNDKGHELIYEAVFSELDKIV